MIKWSRIQLVVSILTAAGLWRTLRERIGYAQPPRPECLKDDAAGGAALPVHYDLAGAFHVHSTYSDGAGTISDIADAAARAGADVVLICDHSSLAAMANHEDGWHHDGKVLMTVGTEVSTDTGHLLLLDIPADMDVQPGAATELMRRTLDRGGYGYIALPCDLKDHWRDFSKRQEGFGLEVFNLSSIARTKISLPGFLLALARYVGKKPLSAFSYIAGRPDTELKLWDGICAEAFDKGEAIPSAIGCLDAHAVMRFGGKDYPFPTYEEVFQICRTHVLVSEEPSRTVEGAACDIARFNKALRSGHSYVSYDNFGDPRGFFFDLHTEKERVAIMGDSYPLDDRRPVMVGVRSPDRKSVIRLIRNGKTISKVRGSRLQYAITKPGVYRVEVNNYRFRVGPFCFGVHPWIFSNPIVVTG